MSEDNLVVSVLLQIRGDLKQIREEARGTNERLDCLNERVEGVERAQLRMGTRLATELVTVGTAVQSLTSFLKERRAHRAVLEDHERRIVALEGG